MARIARVAIPGIPYHITQRGNGRQVVFSGLEDWHVYWKLYKGYSQQYALRTWGYCLMSNHIHLIAVPEREDSMARTLGRTNSDYARYWNTRRGGCGHVWQARYFSCPLEEVHVWLALSYVERNPVCAGVVEAAEQWPWSSAQAHVTGQDASGFLAMTAWKERYTGQQWRMVLRTSPDEEAWRRRLEEATRTGRPFGSDSFVENLERASERNLRLKPPGRSRHNDQTSSAGLSQMALEIGV